MESIYRKKLDRDLVAMIKDPKTCEYDYQRACETMLDRYSRQIHKNWWTLQKQMGSSDYVNAMKDEYYDNAYEAFLTAIRKVDLDRIENDDWKLVGMLNWYLSNVRKKLIRQVLHMGREKSLSAMSEADDDTAITADCDVERAYHESEGFRHCPEYVLELQEGEENCRKALDHCLSVWTEKERMIFSLLKKGSNKKEIALALNITPAKVYAVTKKMNLDLRTALGYGA